MSINSSSKYESNFNPVVTCVLIGPVTEVLISSPVSPCYAVATAILHCWLPLLYLKAEAWYSVHKSSMLFLLGCKVVADTANLVSTAWYLLPIFWYPSTVFKCLISFPPSLCRFGNVEGSCCLSLVLVLDTFIVSKDGKEIHLQPMLDHHLL